MGAIILNRNRVLLVERGKSPLKGYWSLPGGVLETGERLEEGVRREVLEETGLVIKPLRVVKIFERIMRDDRGTAEYHYVLIDYLCRVTGGTLDAASDVSRVEWVPRDGALADYKITEGTLPVIEKAFRESGMNACGRPSAGVLEFEALREAVGALHRQPAGPRGTRQDPAAHRSARSSKKIWPRPRKPPSICGRHPSRSPRRAARPSASISAPFPI